jgi:hypothetical protein
VRVKMIEGERPKEGERVRGRMSDTCALISLLCTTSLHFFILKVLV